MKSFRKILYSWIDKLFLSGCSSYNSLEVRKGSRSKLQARTVFGQNDIPHAQGAIFLSPWKAYRFARQYGFPLVIKPNVSGFSRGSYFPLTTFAELWQAALLVKIWWPYSVIERYLEGANYRVTVANGKIMSIIRRYPPFVDGDGASTISELIDRENAIRQEMQLYPVIHPIPKDRKIVKFIKKQGLSLASIPAAGARVTLFNRIALAPGGVVEIIDQGTVPEENRQLFLKILKLFKANIFGIDAIFEHGIEKSYKEQKCIFLEVNSRPYLKMHDYPRYGKKEDLAQFFAELEKNEISNADIF
ncbi:MAG: cyanophycin synthetase [Thermodesulfobacteriota bacterium]